jgi:sugar-specific transcriptional regulator TrmB
MQILELAAKLQTIGFSDKEAKVYVAALFLGPSSVQKIAEQAEINRATAYFVLEQLQIMGLISESTEGKKTVFIAEGPDAIERWLARQEKDIAERRSELKALTPELKQSQRSDGEDGPVVRFFKGGDGARNTIGLLRRKARNGSSVYTMTNYDEALKIIPDISKTNSQARLKKKLASKMFYSSQDHTVTTDPKLLRETKKVVVPIAADINLYEHGASFSTYDEHGSVGIIIESKEIVAALRQLFDLAWKNSK